MTTESFPASVPTGLLAAADLSFEPEDGLGRELHDGVVYAVPSPSDDHQWTARVLDGALSTHAPDDIYVLEGCGVHTGIRSLYVPDVLVVRATTPFHDNGYDPRGVVLMVEVVSPSSVTMDRHAKPAVYAEVGVPYFWRVEREPLTLTCQRLGPDGRYETVADGSVGTTVRLDQPWSIEVRVDDVVVPHKRRGGTAGTHA